MTHYVYLLGGHSLVVIYKEPIKDSDTYVGKFDADAHCDYVMNMIRINEKLGRPDSYWTKVGELVYKEGI